MIYLIGVLAVGGAILALYERRKNLHFIDERDQAAAPHDRERHAYTESQRIAEQNNPTTMPGNF